MDRPKIKYKTGDTFKLTRVIDVYVSPAWKGFPFILFPYPGTEHPDIPVMYFVGNKQQTYEEGAVTMFMEDFEDCKPIPCRVMLCEKTITPDKYWKNFGYWEHLNPDLII